jgi:hypothetical protein
MSFISRVAVSAVLAGAAISEAASLPINRQVKVEYDFAGQRVPKWSGGALVDFISNRSASPLILTFDDQGREMPALPLTIPGSETVDLDDIARSQDGALAVCGSAYDHSGRGSGFIALIGPGGGPATVIRTHPYYPSRVALGSDDSVWTAGLEVVNGKETGPGVNPDNGVIRHFDRTGKLLGSYIPRSSLGSAFVVQNGRLESANGRIGWYTGPVFGPGSAYYEILSTGEVRTYPTIGLAKLERVTGLALMDNGRTYVTTFDSTSHASRFLSIGAGGGQWSTAPFPGGITKATLYGGGGKRLVFRSSDRFVLTFVDISE